MRGASHPEFSIEASSPFPFLCLFFLFTLITKDLLASFGKTALFKPREEPPQ
jgi:hypothetical protein